MYLPLQPILKISESPGANYKGNDIINALTLGFENKLDFSLLLLVLEDCPQFPQSQVDAFSKMLVAISGEFNQEKVVKYVVSKLVDALYLCSDEEINSDFMYMLNDQGYMLLTYNIEAETAVPGLAYGCNKDMFIQFAYLFDNSGCLLELLCTNRVE